MMYLSRNWKLSEESALNKYGYANVENHTVFEDEAQFERQQVSAKKGATEGKGWWGNGWIYVCVECHNFPRR